MVTQTIRQDILKDVSELWWLWVIQALVAILFGLVAIFWPAITLTILVYLIAPFAIAIGLIETIRSLMTIKDSDTWWMSLVIGFLTIGVGVFLARHPDVSFSTFILVVGIALIAWGIVEVARAFIDKIFTTHRTLSFISGLAGIAAGIIVLLQPIAGGVAFVWILGIWALIYGVTALAISIDNHKEFRKLRDVIIK